MIKFQISKHELFEFRAVAKNITDLITEYYNVEV